MNKNMKAVKPNTKARRAFRSVKKFIIGAIAVLFVLFMLQSCVNFNNRPQAFDGERTQPSNIFEKITMPLTEKGEQLGEWIQEKTK